MSEVEAFRERLTVTLQEILEFSMPPVTSEEFAVFEAIENIIDLIKKHD